jgi:flavin reductase (DIM6/NTAB) family NADH-FMN oxidoreductase RutF
MPLDPEAFRQGMRRWTSGVTVVTAREGDVRHGMTVSAFSSVSAEPPLVLVCANRQSTTHGMIERGGAFAVNVLASDQRDLSARFASPATERTRFEGVAFEDGVFGAPLLVGALASFECNVVSSHVEGSHTIYIGRVEAVRVRDTDPLVYFQGSYRGLGAG